MGASTASAPSAIASAAGVRPRLLQECAREGKWLDMLSNWELWSGRKRRHLIMRARKGIPDSVRAMAWTRFLRVAELRAAKPTLFADYLAAAPVSKNVRAIELDIGRTFPREPLFHERGGIGQQSLLRVLRAYAACDEEVGYCQGMAFLAGVLLSFCPEEDAFLMLFQLMKSEPYMLRRLFLPGLRAVATQCRIIEGLLRDNAPRFAAHLEAQHVMPEMWATSWLMTAFSTSVPFAVTARVWDCLVAEGYKPVVRVAVAVMLRASPHVAKMELEGILMTMRELHDATFEPSVSDAALAAAEAAALAEATAACEEGEEEEGGGGGKGRGATAPPGQGVAAASARPATASVLAPVARRPEDWRLDVWDPDALMRHAFSLRISRKRLSQLAANASVGSAAPDLPG